MSTASPACPIFRLKRLYCRWISPSQAPPIRQANLRVSIRQRENLPHKFQIKCVYFRARKTSIKSDINLIVQRHRAMRQRRKKELPRRASDCSMSAIQLSPNESHDHKKLMRRTRCRSARTLLANHPQSPSKQLTFRRIAANNHRNNKQASLTKHPLKTTPSKGSKPK